ncbi:hypothetical protein [Gordonia sp. (in: high G+C Gram-positive bacteria)]|uniref:hypothetical protein n=1 Tax=Gordonia sp. (in: high G+C Gram-positive bacteria) TaxID=84139 RepID=UPI0016B0B6EE|nr:hypothetical protein [Gordonia sp. (in: high G+C Gram-positive bacteria)]NLG47452.1 hypothetical protein [Gordonia sp. (in: high G+C Gram-positive bacteria)]
MTTPNPFGPGPSSPFGPGGPSAPFGPGGPSAPRTPPPTVGGAFGQVPGQQPPPQPYNPFGGPAVPPAGGPSPFVNPVAPTVQMATGLRGRPIGIIASIVCLVIAAGLSIAQLVRTITAVNDVSDDARRVNDLPLDPTGVRSTIAETTVNELSGTAIFLSVAFTVVAVVVYAVFCWFIWRGAPWARIAAIPFTVLAVIFGVIGGDPIAVTIVVLSVIATACLWLPSSVTFASPVDSPVRFNH